MAGFDGNGNFSFTYLWVNDAANGIPITASRMDTEFGNATSGFDLCITRDNQGKPSATILPDTTNSYDLGSASFTWKNGYFSGAIQAQSIASVSFTSGPQAAGTFFDIALPTGFSYLVNTASSTNYTTPSLFLVGSDGTTIGSTAIVNGTQVSLTQTPALNSIRITNVSGVNGQITRVNLLRVT